MFGEKSTTEQVEPEEVAKVLSNPEVSWPVEDEWNIYIIRAVTLEDGIYFDCYDSEYNDHYGCIHCYNIELENNIVAK